jgi:hypothetical protein
MLIAQNSSLPQLRFKRGVNEICALLGFYAASIGSLLPTFRERVVGGEILTAAMSTGQFTFIVWANSPR